MRFNDLYSCILENASAPVPNSYASTVRFNRDIKKSNPVARQYMLKFIKDIDSGKVPRLEPKSRKFTTQKDGGIADLTEQGVPPATVLRVFGVQVKHIKPSIHFLCTIYKGKCIFIRACDDYNEYNAAIDNLPGAR